MATRSKEKAAQRRENAEKRPHATARYIRISSREVKVVIDLIRGKNVDEALAIDGVDDAMVNPKQGSLAITYVNKDITAEKLLEAIQAVGIEATLPPAHECGEEEKL